MFKFNPKQLLYLVAKSKGEILQAHVANKQYSYHKNDCNLSFTIRCDKEEEMSDFRDLLVKAAIEVDDDLEKFRAQKATQ